MIVDCEKCGDRLQDINVSTVCPHKGIGYCRACDCAICVCSPDTTNRKSNKFTEPVHPDAA